MSAPAVTRKPLRPRSTVLEYLLQGHPEEFLDTWFPDQANSEVDAGVSDRERLLRAAQRWIGNPSLTTEERDRIQVVWLGGEYRPPLNLTGSRLDELRRLLVPREVPA